MDLNVAYQIMRARPPAARTLVLSEEPSSRTPSPTRQRTTSSSSSCGDGAQHVYPKPPDQPIPQAQMCHPRRSASSVVLAQAPSLSREASDEQIVMDAQSTGPHVLVPASQREFAPSPPATDPPLNLLSRTLLPSARGVTIGPFAEAVTAASSRSIRRRPDLALRPSAISAGGSASPPGATPESPFATPAPNSPKAPRANSPAAGPASRRQAYTAGAGAQSPPQPAPSPSPPSRLPRVASQQARHRHPRSSPSPSPTAAEAAAEVGAPAGGSSRASPAAGAVLKPSGRQASGGGAAALLGLRIAASHTMPDDPCEAAVLDTWLDSPAGRPSSTSFTSRRPGSGLPSNQSTHPASTGAAAASGAGGAGMDGSGGRFGAGGMSPTTSGFGAAPADAVQEAGRHGDPSGLVGQEGEDSGDSGHGCAVHGGTQPAPVAVAAAAAAASGSGSSAGDGGTEPVRFLPALPVTSLSGEAPAGPTAGSGGVAAGAAAAGGGGGGGGAASGGERRGATSSPTRVQFQKTSSRKQLGGLNMQHVQSQSELQPQQQQPSQPLRRQLRAWGSERDLRGYAADGSRGGGGGGGMRGSDGMEWDDPGGGGGGGADLVADAEELESLEQWAAGAHLNAAAAAVHATVEQRRALRRLAQLRERVLQARSAGGIGFLCSSLDASRSPSPTVPSWASGVTGRRGSEVMLASLASQVSRLPHIDYDQMRDPQYRMMLKLRSRQQRAPNPLVTEETEELPIPGRRKLWRPVHF